MALTAAEEAYFQETLSRIKIASIFGCLSKCALPGLEDSKKDKKTE